MSDEWQVVDTLHKKKEKLKQKHAENAVENAARQKKHQDELKEKETELKRLGLGFTIDDGTAKKPKKGGKVGKGKSKSIQAVYDIHIPTDDKEKKKKDKDKSKNKEPKAPKEPKEQKDKTGKSLADACAALDVDAIKSELKNIEVQYAGNPLGQLQKLTEALESLFPKVRAFNKHETGHLYRRIHSPIRTLEEQNEEVFNLLKDWIGDRPISSDYVTFLVDLIVDPVSQGVAVRILLSIIARYHPQKIVAESNHVFAKLPIRTSAWVFLQTMYADPDLAVLLWIKHILPMYYDAEKENSEAVVYLACLFTYIRKKGHKINVPMRGEDLAAELGKFLTACATSPETKDFTLIREHYYELLDSAFMVPKDSRKFLEEMLRLTSSSVPEVSNAAFDVIVYNLKTNTDLFNVWKEIYPQNVVATNNVLVFILQNYEHIQTTSLPPIVREPYTYASDAGSDEGDEDDESEKKKKKIKEFGAMMELNGKLISTSRKHAGPVRARPIPVRELSLLLTRVEELNAQLSSTAKKKGSSFAASKQSLEVSNTTCRALRNTISQSRSGRETGGGWCAAILKLTILTAGLAGLTGAALHYSYGPEVFNKIL